MVLIFAGTNSRICSTRENVHHADQLMLRLTEVDCFIELSRARAVAHAQLIIGLYFLLCNLFTTGCKSDDVQADDKSVVDWTAVNTNLNNLDGRKKMGIWLGRQSRWLWSVRIGVLLGTVRPELFQEFRRRHSGVSKSFFSFYTISFYIFLSLQSKFLFQFILICCVR